eukprot:c18244_g1_i3.p1 GENE.c18244_g1_i3~~c18244_g1_i3.p1  ORF type:complete len:233 (+),score=46.78 c18244_g1_i3:620-1318(+)
MLVGTPPFRGGTDYIIFQKILQLDISYPLSLPQDAKDLISRLLIKLASAERSFVVDATKRLGASGDMNEIKRHAFFSGIDFDTLHTQTPPPFHRPTPPPAAIAQRTSNYWAFESFNRPPLSEAEVKTLIQAQSNMVWKQFLLTSEAILMTVLMNKRVGLFARPRQFILTSFPRLLYIHIERMEQRGEVPWSAIVRPEVRNSTTLYIHTRGRVYYLENVPNPSRVAEAISFLL